MYAFGVELLQDTKPQKILESQSHTMIYIDMYHIQTQTQYCRLSALQTYHIQLPHCMYECHVSCNAKLVHCIYVREEWMYTKTFSGLPRQCQLFRGFKGSFLHVAIRTYVRIPYIRVTHVCPVAPHRKCYIYLNKELRIGIPHLHCTRIQR